MGNALQLRRNEVAWRRVGDEVVILDLRSNIYLAVNASGAVLWEMLEEGCTAADLAQRLVGDYGLDASRAAADIDGLVAGLAGEGLLEEPSTVVRP